MFEEIEVSPYLDIGDIKFEELKEIYKLSSTAYQMIRNAHREEVIERFSDKPFIDKQPDVISDSGSCYWYVENNGKPVVYRGSDHWGIVASNKWELNRLIGPKGQPLYPSTDLFTVGGCYFEDFKNPRVEEAIKEVKLNYKFIPAMIEEGFIVKNDKGLYEFTDSVCNSNSVCNFIWSVMDEEEEE